MNLDWIKNRPIAHRGLHSGSSEVPENSLLSFQHAIEKNYPIELDIHLLGDGEIAVFHDENLKRLCGVDVPIELLNAKDLLDYKLLNSSEKIPLLDEVFSLVEGRVPILIEIKNQNGGRNKKLQELLLEKILHYKGDVAVQSFNPFLLKLFAKNAPEIPRGQLSSGYRNEEIGFLKRILLKNYLLNGISRPHFIGHNIDDISDSVVSKLRKKGLIVLSWTLRSKDQYEKHKSHMDNIIFEGFVP